MKIDMYTSLHTPQIRFKFLDSLRGIAALSVVLFHMHALFGITSYSFPVYLDYILSNGSLGVQIFFVLSGFVIAYSIRNANFTFKFLLDFFVRRSIRLDFPYWASLLLMISATLLFTQFISKKPIPFETSQILTNFTYLQTLFGFDSINPVAWTLCIELQLYMFLVVILSLFFRLENTSSIYFPLFFSSLLLVSLESKFHLFSSFSLNAGYFVPYWYSFFIGCAVCWYLIGWISKNSLNTFFGMIAIYSVYSMEMEIWATLCIAMIIHLVGSLGCLSTCMISPVFQYLGKISFSLYLTHWLVISNCINFLCKRVGTINGFKISGIFIFSFIATIVFSHAFYLCIELPFINLSKKYKKRPSPKGFMELTQ